jgi:hypothetical protein
VPAKVKVRILLNIHINAKVLNVPLIGEFKGYLCLISFKKRNICFTDETAFQEIFENENEFAIFTFYLCLSIKICIYAWS